jgi:hypothetical protein
MMMSGPAFNSTRVKHSGVFGVPKGESLLDLLDDVIRVEVGRELLESVGEVCGGPPASSGGVLGVIGDATARLAHQVDGGLVELAGNG